MLNIQRNLPFVVSDHICVENIGSKVLYFNLKNGEYLKLPMFVHEWIVSESKNEISEKETLEILYRILDNLLSKGYITIDFERLKFTEDFIFIPQKNTVTTRERVSFMNVYVNQLGVITSLVQKGYITPRTKIYYICENVEDELNNLDFPINVILKNYSMLTKITNTNFQSIVIEADTLPNDDVLYLLNKDFAHLPITFVVDYGLDLHTVLELEKKTKHMKNIKLIYDLCFMHTCESKYENGAIEHSNKIEQVLLKTMRISCGAGKNKFFVDENGDIFPCYLMRAKKEILGNIFSNEAREILEQQEHYVIQLDKNCSACKVRYFCAGGGRAKKNNTNCNLVRETMFKQLQV